MDTIQDEFYIGRTDFVGGIDNEALDFSQLEDFINNEDEAENTYFVESLSQQDGVRSAGAGTATIVVVESSNESPSGNVARLALQTSTPAPPSFALTHNLPDSPPDSGSEPPYSPQQETDKNNAHSKHNGTLAGSQDILLHSTHSGLFNSHNISHKTSHLHQVHSPHLHEAMLMQHPVLTPLLSANSAAILNRSDAILSAGNRTDAILLSRSDTTAILEMGGDASRLGRVLNSAGGLGSPALIHSPTRGLQPSSPAHSVNNSAGSNVSQLKFDAEGESSQAAIFSTIVANSKKRKLSEDVSAPVLHVKQEMDLNLDLSPESNSSHAVIGEDGYELDGVCGDGTFQCIRFQAFQQSQWHVLCDQNLKELPVPHYRVDADKGFNFSNADDAFVCQKKNHFQITCHTQLLGDAQFIRTPEGVKKITSFYIHFYGVKVESPTQMIKVEQSQSDRSKKPFHPVLVELQGEQVTKITVGRLHFSETTSNNMRKKGKPNPDQRYFHLVVALHAHTIDTNYQIVAHASERIIVRASNPGQFESDVELCWQKGHTQDSIFHAGRVGINTDRPDECLVVHGNLKVTGHIVQPSDLRAKLHLQECNTKEQLKNIEKLRVVHYRYASDFAEELGIEEDTGVIAQEVQSILPDAVKAGGDISLPNGHVIHNFLVVNKDRIFMESVGAVKELCKVTDSLGKRIDEVEKMNRRLAKLKKLDSFRSTTSHSSISSKILGGKHDVESPPKHCKPLSSPWMCSNKSIHISIGVLVIIMALCLVAMATLYFLQTQQHSHIQHSDDEHTVWRSTADPVIRQNNVIRTQMPKRSWTLGTTLSNLLDNNKTATTLSSLLDHHRNRSTLHFLGKERNKAKTHFPTFFHRSTSTDSSLTDAGLSLDVPLAPSSASVRRVRPLGQPANCAIPASPSYDSPDSCQDLVASALSGFQNERTCGSFCCGDILLPAAVKVPLVQDGPYDAHEDDSIVHTKQNEVEGPPPAASNTIDHGQRQGRKLSSVSKRSQKLTDEAISAEIKKTRTKRSADDIVELYTVPAGDQNGVVITVYSAKNLNQSVSPELCAPEVPEAGQCLDRTANNYTYSIPISRYFPDNFIYIDFQLSRGQNRSDVAMCREVLSEVDACVTSRNPPELPNGEMKGFSVDIWRCMSAAIKYRIPLGLKPETMPDLGERTLCSEKIFVPPSFPSIMKGYCKAAIRTQPYDLLRWSACYFRALANGETPPAKDRLEFPPVVYPPGLTPGYLKALINLFGKSPATEITPDDVLKKWQALCLPPDALHPLLALLDPVKFQWLQFVALASASISPSLSQSMILICEILTEDPEGGRAAIPVETFLKLYEFLAFLNCEEPSCPSKTDDDSSLSPFAVIGPALPAFQVNAVAEFMRLWGGRQGDVIMPRNIRHWMCPPLDQQNFSK